jgi:hypothetical protein
MANCKIYTADQLNPDGSPKDGAIGIDVTDTKAIQRLLLENIDKLTPEDFGVEPKGKGQTETPQEKKLRQLIQTGIDKGKIEPISDELKKQFEYDVRGKNLVFAEANALFNSIKEAGGTTEEIETVLRSSLVMNDDTKAALAALIYNDYFQQQTESAAKGDLKQYEYYKNRKLALYKYQAAQGTRLGEGVNAQKWFTDTIEKDPEAAADIIWDSFDEINSALFEDKEVAAKADAAETIIREFTESQTFKDIVAKQVAEEIAKEDRATDERLAKATATAETKKRIQTEKTKVRVKSFFTNLRKGLNGDPNTAQMAMDFGVTKKVLNKAIDLLEKLVLAGLDVSDAVQRTKYFINKQVKDQVANGEIADENWSSQDFEAFFNERLNQIKQDQKEAANVRKQAKRLEIINQLADFAVNNKSFNKNFFGDNPMLAQAAIDEFVLTLDKLNKEVATMSKEKLAKLMSDTIVYAAENGDLTKQNFRRLFAKALGGASLSTLQVARIQQAAGVIQKVGAAQKAYQANPNPTTRAAYRNALLKAQVANKGLSRLVNTGVGLMDIWAASMAGSLLSVKSVFVNISSNIVYNGLIRKAEKAIGSALDFLVTAIQKYVIRSKNFSGQRAVDIIQENKEINQAMWDGFTKSVLELKTGTLGSNPNARDYHTALDPIMAWQRIYEGLAKKDNVKFREYANSLLEGTFGVSGEVMFRLLNLGDRAFADAASAAVGSLLAKNEGITYDELMANPEKYKWQHEFMKMEGDKAVLRQDNPVSTFLSKALAVKNNTARGATKIVATAASPFTKTPVNFMALLVKIANPEINFTLGIVYAYKAADLNKPPEVRWQYRRKSIMAFAQMAIGIGLWAAIKAMFDAGMLQPPPERDKDKKKERGVEYYYGQPSTVKIGDSYISTNSIGFLGAIIDAQAKVLQQQKQEKATYRFVEQPSFFEDYFKNLGQKELAQLQSGLNIGVFTSANTALSVLMGTNENGENDTYRFLKQLLDVFFAPITPADLKKYMKENNDEFLRNTYNDEGGFKGFYNRYVNDFRNNLGLAKDLPLRRDIWGQPIKRNPYGKTAGLTYLFGYREDEPNKFAKDLYKFFKEDAKGDYGIFPPPVEDKIEYSPLSQGDNAIQKEIKLTPKLKDKFEEMVGNQRKALVQDYIDNDYSTDKDNGYSYVKEQISKLYEEGLKTAKDEFRLLYESDLDEEYQKLK